MQNYARHENPARKRHAGKTSLRLRLHKFFIDVDPAVRSELCYGLIIWVIEKTIEIIETIK